MEIKLNIREEIPSDYVAIREVNFQAFNKDKEPQIVEDLRANGNMVLSLVAEKDNQIVGHIVLSRMMIKKEDGTQVKVLAMGPVAVLPTVQKQGVGSQMIKESIRLATERGESAILLLGHKEYYPKFGFSPSLVVGIEHPFNKENFMGVELIKDSLKDLKGRMKYSKAFGMEPEWSF